MDHAGRGEEHEYYALVLFSASGMTLMASANDLIVVFLGLELMSLCLYVLAGYFKQRLDSGEACAQLIVSPRGSLTFAAPFRRTR